MSADAMIPTFWTEPTGKIRRFLRCYSSDDGMQRGVADPKEPVTEARCRSYCNAMKHLDDIEEEFTEPRENGERYRKSYEPADWPWDSFPTVCEACGREMKNPTRQIFTEEIMVVKTGPRAGETFVRRDLPVGAMFECRYYRDIPQWLGWDGMSLCVVTPDGEWFVDLKASNCTMRDDTVHRCWVRHGDPRTGYCHVDKNGTPERPTCQAGAGSIWMKAPNGWHGFLHRGFLVECSLEGDGRAAVDRMLDRGNPVAPAERVLTPLQADRIRVRRELVRRPVVAPATAGARPGWRSNRHKRLK